ncbi:MAG TPA: hypothetical protein PLD47_18620 [Aggregatilineales bacterium]|nr:hypothetical protein [Anaerolineales bacterium]HRE49744.1 hypothetical protein [Aggregatilineales bacterium]
MSTVRHSFDIRPLKHVEDLERVVTLQKMTEGQDTSAIHRHLLISFVHNGGLVMGASHEGQMVGYLISYLGIESPEADRPAMANLKLVSQRMGVLPEFRDHGVGYELKLAQRRWAIEQGIRLVTWTFDPLKSRNAYFNIRKLGAISQEYQRDYYAATPDTVNAETTDRLVVEWWVTHNRVEQRLSRRRAALTITQYVEGNTPVLNPTTLGSDGFVRPAWRINMPMSKLGLVEIPDNWEEMKKADRPLADEWRAHTREALESLLYAGYTITDVLHGSHEDRTRTFYVVSHVDRADLRTTPFNSN